MGHRIKSKYDSAAEFAGRILVASLDRDHKPTKLQESGLGSEQRLNTPSIVHSTSYTTYNLTVIPTHNSAPTRETLLTPDSLHRLWIVNLLYQLLRCVSLLYRVSLLSQRATSDPITFLCNLQRISASK